MNDESISERRGHHFNKAIQSYAAVELVNNKEKHKEQAGEERPMDRERERVRERERGGGGVKMSMK